MKNIWVKLAMAAVAVFTVSATPAMAQATRTWVSGVGDDVNPCSRIAPCRTFAGAISKTAPGGEINALDPGPYGAVTITKSITLSAVGEEGGVLATLGSNGIIINAADTDRVVLRGLDIEGAGTGGNGVRVLSAFDVLIDNCIIHGFRNTATSAGVSVNTTTTGRVTIRNSVVQSNSLAVAITSTGGTGHVKVVNSTILDNFNGGLSVDGAGNDIEIVGNQIFGPVGLIQTNGGVVRSYGGNVIPSAVTPAQTAATK